MPARGLAARAARRRADEGRRRRCEPSRGAFVAARATLRAVGHRALAPPARRPQRRRLRGRPGLARGGAPRRAGGRARAEQRRRAREPAPRAVREARVPRVGRGGAALPRERAPRRTACRCGRLRRRARTSRAAQPARPRHGRQPGRAALNERLPEALARLALEGRSTRGAPPGRARSRRGRARRVRAREVERARWSRSSTTSPRRSPTPISSSRARARPRSPRSRPSVARRSSSLSPRRRRPPGAERRGARARGRRRLLRQERRRRRAARRGDRPPSHRRRGRVAPWPTRSRARPTRRRRDVAADLLDLGAHHASVRRANGPRRLRSGNGGRS